jgi:hypothetical protein
VGDWSTCGHGELLVWSGEGRVMFMPSKETSRSEVPQRWAKASSTAGSLREKECTVIVVAGIFVDEFRMEQADSLSSFPHELLVLDAVPMVHASLHVCWQVCRGPSFAVLPLEAVRETLEPFVHA